MSTTKIDTNEMALAWALRRFCLEAFPGSEALPPVGALIEEGVGFTFTLANGKSLTVLVNCPDCDD